MKRVLAALWSSFGITMLSSTRGLSERTGCLGGLPDSSSISSALLCRGFNEFPQIQPQISDPFGIP